jgi:hypothetical protein
MQHIPRVGQEVVVTFLDGDPDRPLIVGSVYNPSQMPPFDVPENRTQSGIRTRSSPKTADQSAPAGFNEIRFEDKQDGEQLYIHAQKDRDEEVEHDATRWVGNDSTDEVGNDSRSVVWNDSRNLVWNDRWDVVGRDFQATTRRNKVELIKGASRLTVEGDSMELINGFLGVRSDKKIHLKAPTIVIEADTISLRTTESGREFIHLEKGSGITIDSKGDKVWINTGGAGSPADGTYTEPELPSDPFSNLKKDDAS